MSVAPLYIVGQSVSRLALGTWALGGGNDWGNTDEKDALSAIAASLDAGINLIDTAPAYGWGRAEEIVGRALKGHRQQVLLTSKCGIVTKNGRPDHNLSEQSVIAQCEESLKRLQTDYIDLYLIHWPDPKIPLEETAGALCRLKEQGKIRAIGVCNFSVEQAAQAADLFPLSCVQNPLSLLQHEQKEVLDFCQNRGVAFMAYGVLGGGILSGKYKKMPNLRRCDARRYFYPHYFGEGFEAAQAVALRIKELSAQKNLPPVALALAWALAQEGVNCALFGARNAVQVQENVLALQINLSASEKEFLQHG